MITTRLEIGGTLVLERNTYEGLPPDACFEFTEHATDHWNRDSVTDVSIDEAMARQIVEALNSHFHLGYATVGSCQQLDHPLTMQGILLQAAQALADARRYGAGDWSRLEQALSKLGHSDLESAPVAPGSE